MFFSGNVANGRSSLPSHNDSLVLKSGQEPKFYIIYEISRQTNKCPTRSDLFQISKYILDIGLWKEALAWQTRICWLHSEFWLKHLILKSRTAGKIYKTEGYKSVHISWQLHPWQKSDLHQQRPSGPAQSWATVGTEVSSALSHFSPKADFLDLEVYYLSN